MAEASSGQEETIAVSGGEESSVHAVLLCPRDGRVVVELLPFFLGGHAPAIAPPDGGSIILWLQNSRVVIWKRVVVLSVFILREGFGPSDVVAIFLRRVGTYVAGGPTQAARQAEVDLLMVVENRYFNR